MVVTPGSASPALEQAGADRATGHVAIARRRPRWSIWTTLATGCANVPVQRRAAQRIGRCNRLSGSAASH